MVRLIICKQHCYLVEDVHALSRNDHQTLYREASSLSDAMRFSKSQMILPTPLNKPPFPHHVVELHDASLGSSLETSLFRLDD